MLHAPSVLRLDRQVQAVARELAVNAGNVRLDATCEDRDDLHAEWRQLKPQRVAVGMQGGLGGVVCGAEDVGPATANTSAPCMYWALIKRRKVII